MLNLLNELQARLGIAILIITHNLNVVRHIADRVAVMYLGRIVEEGPTAEIFARPRHRYTAALLSANPEPDPDAVADAAGNRRRRAEPVQPAAGLRVPSPLSVRAGSMQQGFSGLCLDRGGTSICLPQSGVNVPGAAFEARFNAFSQACQNRCKKEIYSLDNLFLSGSYVPVLF